MSKPYCFMHLLTAGYLYKTRFLFLTRRAISLSVVRDIDSRRGSVISSWQVSYKFCVINSSYHVSHSLNKYHLFGLITLKENFGLN